MATTSTPLSSQKTFSSPPKPLKSTVPSPPPPIKSSTTQLPPLDPPHRPNPPAPEPPPSTGALVPAPLPETLQTRKWTDLFAKKPWNAGVFEAPPITLQYKGNALLPSDDIYEAGKEVWRNYLVGFFLDAPLSYTVVSNHLQNLWKPSGGIKIKSTGKTFLFLLSDPEDRKRILCADPVFIRNKLFILKPWDCNAGSSTIRNVPVWIKLSNLPLYAWSKPGISWLASHIGRFVCMDAATESLDRLSFAKCLVEVTLDSLLPHEFPVMLPDDTEQLVYVEYVWRPDICDGCKSFGHKNENCSLVGSGKSNVYRGETIVGSEKNKEKDDRNANNKGGGINNQPTGRSNNPASIKQTWTKVVGRKNSAVSNTNTSMQETVSNEHGNNMVSNDIGQASVNSFNVLSNNLDSMAETQTNLETEVQNLSTVVEDGEYEEVASDYDGYLDIPLPIFNEATVGPVFVQAGIAMQNDIAGKGSGCEASVTEVEEGEVRQFDVHVRNEGSLTKMTELVDEVLTFGTELSNIKSTGENSEDAVVTCQHDSLGCMLNTTRDGTVKRSNAFAFIMERMCNFVLFESLSGWLLPADIYFILSHFWWTRKSISQF